jgi:hypothetical protein
MKLILQKSFFGIALVSLLTSCVSSQIYDDLKSKYELLKTENESLMSQLDASEGNSDRFTVANLSEEIEKLNAEKSRLAMELAASESNYERLKTSYNALEANSSSALTENLIEIENC